MQPEVYRMIAMLFRYWLAVLMIVILWLAIRWLYRERAAYIATLRVLPDAGLIGELVDLETGKSYPLPREGFIGGKRQADIGLKGIVYPIHFELIEHEGILIEASKRLRALVDDKPVGKKIFAYHGSFLEAGAYRLRFRLFEGVPVPEMNPTLADGIDEEGVWDFPDQQMWIVPSVIEQGGQTADNQLEAYASYKETDNLEEGFCLDDLKNKTPSTEPWGDEEWTDGQ